MTKDEIRTLASPRVRQLVDHLRRLKPTSTYKIEAVLRSEGGSDVSATNSEGESSESISVASGRWSTSRNYRKNKKHRGVRPNASGFVAPHGLESMSDEENYVDERNENTSISSFSTTSDDDVGTANNSKCSGENSEESGAESDATDVSMYVIFCYFRCIKSLVVNDWYFFSTGACLRAFVINLLRKLGKNSGRFVSFL